MWRMERWSDQEIEREKAIEIAHQEIENLHRFLIQKDVDKIFSLDIGRCFGACGLAPVIMINDDIYQRVKPAKIYDILNKYKMNNNEDTNGVK